MAMTAREMELTRQKAMAGQKLAAPTPDKLKYYNQVQTTAGQPKGWGVGYGGNNVSGGFANWTDPSAMQNEISRMNTVMQNRTKSGMNNIAEQNYLNSLNERNKPYASVNPDQYRTQEATIDDIAKKYGFDFSREYANRQAEAEAQAKRNAVEDAKRKNASNKELNMKGIDNNLMDMADGLDRNYFQKGLQQAQMQTENGLNGGIAADQNLRLAMSRQAEMGGAYRDANLGRMQENQRFTNDDLRLAEEMGLIDQQALAREDSLFNDRLQLGFDNAMQLTGLRQNENLAMMNSALQQRGQNLDYNKFSRGLDWDKQMFGKVSATDRARMEQERYMFNNMSAEQRAANQRAYAQLNEQKRQFNSEEAWRKHTYNNLSATDKARIDADIRQFGETMAWNKFEMEYMAEQQLAIARAGAGQGYDYGDGMIGPNQNGSVNPFLNP